MLGQTPIGRIPIVAPEQAVQLGFQPPGSGPQAMQRDLVLQIAIAQGQSLLQDLLHRQEREARIVSLSPGPINSPMRRFENERSPIKAEHLKYMPLRREGTMLEVADAAEFLTSDRASFVTGTDLLLDGGLMTRRPPNLGKNLG